MRKNEQCFQNVAIDGEFPITVNISEKAECQEVETA